MSKRLKVKHSLSSGSEKGKNSSGLDDGARIGVIGGGPAGSFFSYFLLSMAERIDLNVHIDVYEPRDFSRSAPAGCNMCGGIVSESLVQALAVEGIELPSSVLQKGIDSYILHMDVGSVRIDTPLQEMRIGAVYRGGGPKGGKMGDRIGFDGFLQDLVVNKGAYLIQDRIVGVEWNDGHPQIKLHNGTSQPYDLLVVAAGINTSVLKFFQSEDFQYRPPQKTRTYISEFCLGEDTVEKYLGSSMHVFLLDIPSLEFAAIIPKGEYVTLCILGENIDKDLVSTFVNSDEVRKCFPPDFNLNENICQCMPFINVKGAVPLYSERIVFIGDSGISRLYKDGIGASYRTAKAAATTVLFQGISKKDFRNHYWPTCKSIRTDNSIGKVIFKVTKLIQKRRFTRRAILSMVSREQQNGKRRRRMSMVLWDTFTGSAPYQEILLRTFHPAFWLRLLCDAILALWPFNKAESIIHN